MVSGYYSGSIKSINNITFGKRFIPASSMLEIIVKNSHFESFERLEFIAEKAFCPNNLLET